MALEEEYYDPTLPREKIGVGAKPLPSSARVLVGFLMTSNIAAWADSWKIAEFHGKRKIRRKAEEKLGSQSQTLWDDIMGQVGQAKPSARDQWEDPTDDVSLVNQDHKETAKPASKPAAPKKSGIFSDSCFVVHGYGAKEVRPACISNILF
jgi:hypothetical protein